MRAYTTIHNVAVAVVGHLNGADYLVPTAYADGKVSEFRTFTGKNSCAEATDFILAGRPADWKAEAPRLVQIGPLDC